MSTISPHRMMLLIALAGSPLAVAEALPPTAPPTLETVMVVGKMPGPGLWRVHGQGNELFILATLSPLPSGMQWDASDVSEILDRAGAVVSPGGAEPRVGAGDMLKMASLARSANAAMKIPDRGRLADLLPASDFAQWQRLSDKYVEDAARVDRLRPVFAAQELHYDAIRRSGMTRFDKIWHEVEQLAAARNIPVMETKHRFDLEIDRVRYKAGIKALASSRSDELTCFRETMETLEGDLEAMRKNANAWAIGDVDWLLANEGGPAVPVCKRSYDALMGFQKDPAIDRAARQAWLAAAKSALTTHRTSLAVVPMDQLIGPGGLREDLLAAGYQVEQPE